ncbi:MAG: hypothetical protein GY751_04785 [Bacteroidetes bacterium]|nr:hypothetical protein [Bacteroidota bacterium]
MITTTTEEGTRVLRNEGRGIYTCSQPVKWRLDTLIFKIFVDTTKKEIGRGNARWVLWRKKRKKSDDDDDNKQTKKYT